MASFQPSLLQQQLQPFNLHAATSAPEQQAFLDFYGLNDPLLAQHHIGYVEHAGRRIATQAFFPAQPVRGTVLLMHGYYDHIALFRSLIQLALSQHYAVFGWDLPGHGLSEGSRSSIDDFREYQALLDHMLHTQLPQMPGPLQVIAQSTGCAIIMDWLLSNHITADNNPFDQIILLAPLVRPHGWISACISHTLIAPFVSQIARSFGTNSHDEAFLRFVREQDPLQDKTLSVAWVGALRKWVPHFLSLPASTLRPLIVQGHEDMTVDWRYNLRVLHNKFANATVLHLAEGRHHLAGESEAIKAQYFPAIQQRLTPPPSA